MEQDHLLLPQTVSGHQNDAVEEDDAPPSSLGSSLKEFLTEQNHSLNESLAQEVLTLCNSDSKNRVACPSLYAYLKNIDSDVNVQQLLEYDRRFEQYGSDFTFYDYNQPEDLPLELKHGFDIVVADPPYLSQEKVAWRKLLKLFRFLHDRKNLTCSF